MTIIKDKKNSDGKWGKSYRINGYKVQTKAYSVWCSMLYRCKADPNYSDCIISENFKDFQYFATWCQTQVGYGTDGYHLDKDILSDTRCYSEDNCVFIPSALNLFLTDSRIARTSNPQGVRQSGKNSYRVEMKINSIKTHIGVYRTIDEARLAYKAAKEKEAQRWVSRLKRGEYEIDARVYLALKKFVFVQNDIKPTKRIL